MSHFCGSVGDLRISAICIRQGVGAWSYPLGGVTAPASSILGNGEGEATIVEGAAEPS